MICHAPAGRKQAISSVPIGAARQRCRVHVTRHVLAVVLKVEQVLRDTHVDLLAFTGFPVSHG